MSASFIDFFKSILLLIFSEECFDIFFIKYDFFHGKYTRFDLIVRCYLFADFIFSFSVPCLKYALSKCLGYGIIGGSVLGKSFINVKYFIKTRNVFLTKVIYFQLKFRR